MPENYFGVAVPHGAYGWRIQPLTRLVPRTGRWQREAAVAPGEFGPTGHVFWPPNMLQASLTPGTPVRFQCEENFNPTARPDWDHFRLSWAGNNIPAVWIYGAILLPESKASWRKEPRRVLEGLEGVTAYVHVAREGIRYFIGPWRCEGGILVPVRTASVSRYPAMSVSNDDLITWRDFRGQVRAEFLLNEPPENSAETVDLATPDQQAKWLIDRLRSLAGPAVADLDQRYPGWRTNLRSEFEALGDHSIRALWQNRWERVTELLDHLSQQNAQQEQLVANPRFQEQLNVALQAAVQQRTQEIQKKAAKEAKAELEMYQTQRQEVLKKILDRQKELTALERSVEARKKWAQDALQLDEATTRIVEARNHLAEELGKIRDLLPATMPANTASSANKTGPAPPPAMPSLLPTNGTALQGTALDSSPDFVDRRLFPALAKVVKDATPAWARIFHQALLGCPWVLVPHPSWGRIYADALGGTGKHCFISVEATWLRFADAWTGEVEDFWRRAANDPQHVYLLVFDEVNRSLPQCWARAWLNILEGHRPTLPATPPVAWPSNLRVLATMASDAATLSLEPAVVARWGAIPRQPIGAPKPRTEVVTAHVLAETWLGWSLRDSARPLVGHPTQAGDLDDFILLLMAGGLDEESARNVAENICQTWPRVYLFGGSDGSARPAPVLAQ